MKYIARYLFTSEFNDDDNNNSTSETISINDSLIKYKEFSYIHQRTGLKPLHFIFLIFLSLAFLLIGYIEHLLTCLVGILYPLYFSIKALRESSQTSIKRWLQYWIVFSLFANFEAIFGNFLQNIPLYFFYKIVFLLICFLPEYNGAEYFYRTLLKPIFNRYHNHIYEYSVQLFNKIKSTVMEDQEEDNVDTQ